ncbi:uncharacterized protein [Rutidosis leptorrhynchoides]|uniref:uncharacterized protein n=1 Tax=Rutidosis leptorrhynchoides TaxID=125765 RepID=UPI003A9977F8
MPNVGVEVNANPNLSAGGLHDSPTSKENYIHTCEKVDTIIKKKMWVVVQIRLVFLATLALGQQENNDDGPFPGENPIDNIDGPVIGPDHEEDPAGLDSQTLGRSPGRARCDCNFIQKAIVGKSGGQLLIWDTNVFDASSPIFLDHAIGVRGVWKNTGAVINVLNIYGPHDDIGKQHMWNSISNLLSSRVNEAWLLCGDFNEVRDQNCKILKFYASESVPESYSEIEILKAAADRFESKAELGLLVGNEYNEWRDIRKQWIKKEGIKTKMFKQKARVRWILEDEENSKFFHNVIRRRNDKSRIRGLTLNGVWNENPQDLKDAIFEHFRNVFTETNSDRPSLEDLNYPSITSDEASALELPFDEKEVHDVVFDCGSTKAPDLVSAVAWFWENSDFSKGCNACFVTLVPKRSDPITLGDFRPISLIGSYYKIDAKVLSNRLRKVLPSLIGSEQSAFLKDRFILDGGLIVNESIDFLKANNQKSLLFKVDFEKAFDCLNWDFILEVMRCMGFGCKWRKWILSCLNIASISILFNGSPTKEFSLSRGVRQGDPLSPFLFILAAEVLNILSKAAIENGLFKGTEIGADKVLISHLQYADDTIFLGKWSRENVYSLRNLLKCFELASGLKVNFQKSCIYGIGVDFEEVSHVASRVGCQVGVFSFTYLGLPIGSKMLKLNYWSPVIEKIKGRLSDWRMRTLSFGGRVVLIKSVLNSLPLYYFSLFQKSGTSIEDMNVNFKNSFVKAIADGSNTLFWDEQWAGAFKLRDKFRILYKLEGSKLCSVRDRMWSSDSGTSFGWNWIRNPIGRTESEYNQLLVLLSHVHLDNSKRDCWTWSLSNSGNFNVKALTNIIEENSTTSNGQQEATIRNNLVPKKLEVFVWRAIKKRLPVRYELDKRGIDLHSVLCPLCNDDIETVDHSFLFCKHSMELWERVFRWWGFGSFSNLSLHEILRGNTPTQTSTFGKLIWQSTECFFNVS